MELKTYTASAGSGKTFRLTVEYISKLLKDPYSYKTTLAVTFTNKATNEMKSRILSVLWSIIFNPEDVKDEIKEIEKELGHSFSQSEKDNAKKALDLILHDYHHFWIETIDSFFQRVLRNMAKEVGVSSGFEILLNDEEYLKRVIEELKEDAEVNPQLKKCLNDLIQSRIQEGKKWNYETDMLDFVTHSKEDMIANAYSLNDNHILDAISQETKEAFEKIAEFEQRINDYIKEAKKLSQEYVAQSGEYETKSLQKFIYSAFINGYDVGRDSDSKILKKLSKETKKSFKDISERFEALREFFSDYYEKNYQKIKTLHTIYSSAYKICLLLFINQRKQELLKSDNLFLLKNTQKLLNDMIEDDTVVPFVYEKIGSKVKDIMIDEFQDTSTQAWQNFTHLIKESIANGGNCAVFGDIKQSIYRWNDGDWQILKTLSNDKGNNEYGITTVSKPLEENWRTDEEIVKFNNEFFAKVFSEYGKLEIKNQIPKKNLAKGEIRISFVDKYDTLTKSDNIMRKTVQEIYHYIDLGYKVDDIMLLFRDNKKAKKMADFLRTETNFKPSSSTAFYLESNSEVQKIILLLKYIADKKDSITSYSLQYIHKIKNLDSLNKYNPSSIALIDLVIQLIEDFEINIQDTFVSAFCDKLTNYCLHKGNSLKEFLAYWNETMREEAVIIGVERGCIELQTIHKSKGLEKDVVILPFCDWNLTDNKNDVWFENLNPNSAVRVFPTKVKNLENMGEDYKEIGQKERYLQMVDNINILYVAFTRAKHCLSVISPQPAKTSETISISKIIHEHLKNENIESIYDFGCEDFAIGSPNPKNDSIKQEKKSFNPFKEDLEPISVENEVKLNFSGIKYALSKSAKDFFESEEEINENEKTAWGSLVHSVLSQIKTESNLQTALLKVDNEKRERVNEVIQSMFKFSQSQHWFDGTYKILNEKSIVDKSSEETIETKRPDRIMIQGNDVIVVDYKFLEDLNDLEKYETQILKYGELFSKMGYENISLYLWGVESSFSKLTLDFGEVNQRIIKVEF
ncbi:MAG: UvrD-helicase domain-containing protein [Bacteroidales bacterium]|nr:UvrD-helicase domain-containing protein [Bacteroidales bacterium]